MTVDNWEFLSVFSNKTRVEIVRILLELEYRSLSEIAERLEQRGYRMTLPGVIKHMRELEEAGVVRHESGAFAKKPDARKTIYFLEGRERIKKLLKDLENDVLGPLQAGVVFSETAGLAREVQRMNMELAKKDRRLLESLLAKCELDDVYRHLTDDEKKKLRLWRMMMSIM